MLYALCSDVLVMWLIYVDHYFAFKLRFRRPPAVMPVSAGRRGKSRWHTSTSGLLECINAAAELKG